jgi:DNA-directed RNA polymerase subunit RPC12/RpoP
MVEYICENCGKNFGNIKTHYTDHLKRKFKCKAKEKITIIEHQQSQDCTKKDEKFTCNFCNQNFTRNSTLNRHINSRCKVKKEQDEAKAKEKEEKEKNEKQMHELIELNKQLIKQNEEFKQQLLIVKAGSSNGGNINTNNSHNVTNNNNITTSNSNNNNTVNVQIVNYGSEDYDKLDNKLFFEPMVKGIGKQIFLKMIENVYINPDIPENHNIVITDRNRQRCKTYKDNKWRTTDIKIINDMLRRIIYHAKEKHEEFNEQYENNNAIKDKLKTAKKHIDRCDPDYLADLIEEQEKNEKVNNKSKIKDCNEFYDMIYNDTIALLHDMKNVILKPKT